ncbi:MAG: type II secretion system F family protein [Candidatus Eremiobacteraeota bacterium]|nr:type II secretion system F family protein [Candidatus Eremiobacteraeota bacterium]
MLTKDKHVIKDVEPDRDRAFAKALLPYEGSKVFKFKAHNREGGEISGYVRAKTKDAAVKGLLDNNYAVQEIEETTYDAINTVPIVLNPLRLAEAVTVFTRQLLVLYHSGVPLNRAVSILFVQCEDKHLKTALSAMYMDMVRGTSFTRSIARHPHVFSADYVAMVDAGEKSGELASVLERLAVMQEKNLTTFRRVLSAMTYPIIVLFFSLLVNFAIFQWVLPSFLHVFESMNVELPIVTVIIIWIVKFMKTPWFWISLVAFISMIFILAIQVKKNPAVKYLLDSLLLRVPKLGNLIRWVIFINTFRLLATMLSSGVIVNKALKNVSEVAGNEIYKRAFNGMVERVEKGDSLPDCFDDNKKLFPIIVRQMIHVGDETGEPEVVLNLLSDFYEDGLNLALEELTSILEPFMVGLMGLVVGFIVIAVFLPIYSLINKMI